MTGSRRHEASNERSCVRGARRVKPREAPQDPDRRRGLRRHLEGWETGCAIVVLGALTAVLVAPRRVVPDTIPVPYVDRAVQEREAAEDDRRADVAELGDLPYEVRAVGEHLRRYGRSVAAGDGTGARAARRQLVAMVKVARAHGGEALRQLRAVQTRLFLRAVARWAASGTVDEDLRELGGDFAGKARRSRWVDGGGRVVLDPEELATLFLVRWSQLTGLQGQEPLALSSNTWRAYYRLLLEHPEGAAAEPRRAVDQRRLRYVEAAARYDPDYPAAVARGILSYRLGAYRAAVEAFRSYRATHPGGGWQLRVQNYLAEAVARDAEARSP